jgi:hypothetical protein
LRFVHVEIGAVEGEGGEAESGDQKSHAQERSEATGAKGLIQPLA